LSSFSFAFSGFGGESILLFRRRPSNIFNKALTALQIRRRKSMNHLPIVSFVSPLRSCLRSRPWRCAKTYNEGWQSSSFDDKAWSPALVLGSYSMAPWGKLNDQTKSEAPQAAGIPNDVRIIYVPQPQAIRIHQLGVERNFTATYFDPVSGETNRLGIIHSDAQENWTCPPPVSVKEQDWVLILEAKK